MRMVILDSKKAPRGELTLPQSERNPVVVYLSGLANSARRSMASKLRMVSRSFGFNDPSELDWVGLRFEHVAAIRSRLVELAKAPATINATLCALRGVARAAWHLGYMTAEDYRRIADIPSVRGSRLPAGRALTQGEIVALFNACIQDDSPAGVRDAALIALQVGSGLRRSECTALTVEDYDRSSRALTVKGKGSKTRLTYLNAGGAAALSDWLHVRGNQAGPLFHPIRKGGTIERRSMTDQALYDAIRKRAREARVKTFSPHDLRRTFVTELIDATGDIVSAQRLAGHENVQTTTRYDRRGEEGKKRAISALHIPYEARFEIL